MGKKRKEQQQKPNGNKKEKALYVQYSEVSIVEFVCAQVLWFLKGNRLFVEVLYSVGNGIGNVHVRILVHHLWVAIASGWASLSFVSGKTVFV